MRDVGLFQGVLVSKSKETGYVCIVVIIAFRLCLDILVLNRGTAVSKQQGQNKPPTCQCRRYIHQLDPCRQHKRSPARAQSMDLQFGP